MNLALSPYTGTLTDGMYLRGPKPLERSKDVVFLRIKITPKGTFQCYDMGTREVWVGIDDDWATKFTWWKIDES